MASFEESVKYFHKQHMTIIIDDDKYVGFRVDNSDKWLILYLDLHGQILFNADDFSLDTLYHALNIIMECKCDDVSQTCANIISKVNAVVPGLAKKEEKEDA